MIRISDGGLQPYETEHNHYIREHAAECTLFLVRDHAFPLHGPCRIAAYGNGVRHTIKGGTGSGDVNVRHFTNVEEGLAEAGFEIITTGWLQQYDEVLQASTKAYYGKIRGMAARMHVPAVMLAMGKSVPEPEYELPYGERGDAAIYVVARNSGEGNDRSNTPGDVQLTDTEIRDIVALNRLYDRFMLVLNTGGLVDLTPVQEVKNILLLGQLGSCTGSILADILLGRSNPSGKLTMTWTASDAYPSTEGFGDPDDTCYREGIFVGYRYFDSVRKKVLYPFGYGLSYTDFVITGEEVCIEGDTVGVRTLVKNTGDMMGQEVVQLYVSSPAGKLNKPYQALAGFAKTEPLKGGECSYLTISFSMKDLASYDTERAAWILEKGDYILRLGNQSRATAVCGIVEVPQEILVRQVKNCCAPNGWEEEPIAGISAAEREEEALRNVQRVTLPHDAIRTETVVYKEPAIETEDVSHLSLQEQMLLCVGSFDENAEDGSVIGAASKRVAGGAGETTDGLTEKYGIRPVVMADGPAGIRINSSYRFADGKVTGIGSAFGDEMMELLSEEELAAMAAMAAAPEPQNAAVYYQYCCALPIGTDLAQAFHPDLLEDFGRIVAQEMQMFGIDLWLSPALNIQRSPLCGRCFEYYSEDPLVSGLSAAAIVRGVQSVPGCGATIKHFACNNQETNRYTSNSVLSERALREIYLKGFEICIRESQPVALMSSYNLINGVHACNSRELMTSILRDEMGFRGMAMTDWYATTKLMKRPDSKYAEASAAGCLKAGNDLVMPGGRTDMEDIQKAQTDPKHPYHLSEQDIAVCAGRMLHMITRETK